LTRVHALVDRIVAQTSGAGTRHDQASDSEMVALVRELDATMEFFRLEPRRTIREDGD